MQNLPRKPFEPIKVAPAQEIQGPTPSQLQQAQYFTAKEERPSSGFLNVILKLLYIVFFLGILGAGGYFFGRRYFFTQMAEKDQAVLLQHPYQPVLWKDFGVVFEPIIKVPVYYPGQGYVEKKFLLDSGALVSSLPREEAEKMNFDLAMLPRSTFAGFGNTTSFAYRAEVKIKIGENETTMPVVFTEAGGTKAIIGRSGFFEKFSVYFNAGKEIIEIRE